MERKFSKIARKERLGVDADSDNRGTGRNAGWSSFVSAFKKAAEKKKKEQFKRNYGRRVDFHSRYVFPLMYVVFNAFYWSGYLYFIDFEEM